VPVAHGKYLAGHITRANLVELPGTEQSLIREAPQLVLDHIEEFLTGARHGEDPPGSWPRCCSPTSSARPSRPRDQLRGIDVRTRAGLHVGEVERRDDDVGGMAVHIAARVMAAQHDEMLVSRAIRDLVVGSDIVLDDRGTRPLRGVEGDWQLSAVHRPGNLPTAERLPRQLAFQVAATPRLRWTGGRRWALASTTYRPRGAKLGGEGLRSRRRRPPVTNREVAVVALGRFLVVERYRETHQPPSTHHPLRGPGEEGTGEHASRSASAASPASPRPGAG
jgi:hypothetical protein